MFSRKSVFSIVAVLLVTLMTSSFASARPLTTSFTPRSQLISGGVPAGFANDVDNSPVYQTGYQNIKVVAKSGGDFTTITDALNSITDASDTNHYLIYIAPGVYEEHVTMKEYVDIEGAGELTTKITFTGSSTEEPSTVVGANNAELRFLTVLNTSFTTHVHCAAAIQNENTSPSLIHVTARAEASSGTYNCGIYNALASPKMTNVTAVALGASNENYGMHNNDSSPTMTDVTAIASGGNSSYGVYNINSSPTMTNVEANALNGAYNYGVYNRISSSPRMANVIVHALGERSPTYGVYNLNSSSPTMTNVTINVSGTFSSKYGIYNLDSSSPMMTNVTINVSATSSSNYGMYNLNSSSPMMTDVTISALGGMNNYGVYNSSSSSPRMTYINITGWGGTNNYGVYNSNSSPLISNSFIATGGGTYNYGIYNDAPNGNYIVQVNNSQIIGGTNTIRNNARFLTRVGASQLTGGPVTGGGTVTCAGVYDENYAFFASTCP